MKQTWEDRINLYEEAIKKLQQLRETKEIADYFQKVGKRNNMYIVEMRRILAVELFNTTRLNKIDIAAILNKDHSSILHLIQTLPNPYCTEEVLANYKNWIKEGKVPVNLHKRKYSPEKDIIIHHQLTLKDL